MSVHNLRHSSLAPRLSLPAAAAALILLAAAPAEAREYFVSGTGTDANNTEGTLAKPFRTIQKAADLTVPGDVVTVLNGEYKNGWPTGSAVDIKRSGAAGKWIKYRAYPGHKPRIKFNGWNGINIHGGASYIEITGFDIEGNIKNTTLDYCKSKAKVADPLCNGNGVSIDGRDDGANKPHHIRIAENEVHHCAGAGISAIAADYITFEDNLVHDNSWYTQYATSGISILTPWMLDQGTGHKMFIRRNQLWNNRTLVPWSKLNKLSDGNGIIIDTTNEESQYGMYAGRFLVASNLAFNNGGSGIHAYHAAHVDILNNTAFHNGQVVGYEEIFANSSSDVKILNNIMVARPGGAATSNYNNKSVTYDYNIYHNGPAAVVGPHDLKVDPGFVSPSTNPAVADFQLKASSQAVDSGVAQPKVVDDVDGAPRPQGAAIDRGAHERTPSAQLLQNGDFEAGSLAGWFVYQNTVVVGTAPIAGKFSARAGTGTLGGGGEQGVTVQPGKKYTLKGTGRVEGGSWAAINYQFVDAQNAEIGEQKSLQLGATNAEHAATVTAPANAAKLVVSFWTSKGLLTIDGLSLVAAD